MSAPDFYFAVNAIFRHLHDRFGKPALIEYWRRLGREYYAARVQRWKQGGADAIAADWEEYFSHEPGAQVQVHRPTAAVVELDVRVCPAIKHLRDNGRDALAPRVRGHLAARQQATVPAGEKQRGRSR
jgi:hypothetical protein